jgi:hypothetical protein
VIDWHVGFIRSASDCGFSRSLQQFDENAPLAFRSLVFSLAVRSSALPQRRAAPV